jgi:hypothetical protein
MASALEKAQAIHDAEIVSSFYNGKDEGKDERTIEIAKNAIERKMNLEDI